MIDKYRWRMNGGEGYITTEISQRKKGGRPRGGRRPRKRKGAPGEREELGVPVLG